MRAEFQIITRDGVLEAGMCLAVMFLCVCSDRPSVDDENEVIARVVSASVQGVRSERYEGTGLLKQVPFVVYMEAGFDHRRGVYGFCSVRLSHSIYKYTHMCNFVSVGAPAVFPLKSFRGKCSKTSDEKHAINVTLDVRYDFVWNHITLSK